MSITSDLNLMDLLFDKEDPSMSLPGLEKDDLGFKNNFDADLKSTFDLTSDMWTSPDEFLNSILSMDDPPFEMLHQPLPETTDDDVCTSSASDSGILSDRATHDDDSGGSLDLHMSPASQDFDEDVEVVEHPEPSPEVITLDDNVEIDPMSQGEVQLQDNTAIISMNLPSITQEIKTEPVATPQKLTLRTVQSRRLGRADGMHQVIRVTPLVASGGRTAHPRSILLPVNLQDVKDVRTIKIINAPNANVKRARCRPVVPAVGKATPVALVQVRPPVNQANSCYSSSSSSSSTMGSPRAHSVLSGDESGDESSDSQTQSGHFQYPRLVLSAEEKRLMQKEGVTLPTHYPLTKQEERELKRIRRKIRNKISAQDSRKRKKEYVDGLEDRVKQCTDENRELLKRLKALETQNESLTGQLHRLRSLLSRNSSKAVQPATCMMVLLLSLALVMVPTLRPNANSLEEQELSAASAALSQPSDGGKLSTLPGRSRTLLYSQLFGSDLTEDIDVEMEDVRAALPPLGKRRAEALLQDHDYSPPMSKKSRTEYLMSKFVDFPVDDVWPPKKDPVNTIEDRIDTVVELLSSNNKSDLGDSFIADDSPAAITLPFSHEGF